MGRVARVSISLLLLLVAIVLLPAVPGTLEWFGDTVMRVRNEWYAAQNRRPPRRLPIRAEDPHRYPRKSFGFVLSNDSGFRLDTFRGTVTRRLSEERDTTIALALSPAEIDTVYQAMLEMRFFEYPEPHPPFVTATLLVPNYQLSLQASAGGHSKRQTWSTGEGPVTWSDEWKRLLSVTRTIQRMVAANQDFQALPIYTGPARW
jgi:hypothetical protein